MGHQEAKEDGKSQTWDGTLNHQEFQVPKMEGFLNLIFGYFGGGYFPYISRIHTAYIGEDSSILGT